MYARMRVIAAPEVAASAPGRWRRQYRGRGEDTIIAGRMISEIEADLRAIDPTPAEISRVLNESWAYPSCSICGQYVPVAAECGEEWSDSKPTICLACAEQIVSLLRQFPGADQPVPPPSAPALPAGELP